MRTLPAWLDRLLGRARPAGPEVPADPRAADHRRRALRRELREARKLIGHGCSTCVQEEPSKARIRVGRRIREIEAELAAIDRAHRAR